MPGERRDGCGTASYPFLQESPTVRLRFIIILALALAALIPTNAHAFMTWNAPGNAEHERITRLGIACNSALDRTAPAGLDWREDLCLPSSAATNKQPWWFGLERPMRMLAGTDGYFGGVGAPDRFYEAMIDSADYAHCDNGDAWFPAFQGPFGNYPRSLDQRTNALRQCMYLLQQYVGVSVSEAGKLVRADGTIDAPQSDLSDDCNVDYDPWLNPGKTHDRGWAKCNALISFGRALHITQDFFSHSNWIDQTSGSLSITNPQGLANDIRVVPSVLGYPRYTGDIEKFLSETQVITGAYGSGTNNRVKHNEYLNKDEGKGTIDWTTGQIPFGDGGHSKRAATGFNSSTGMDNFQRAAKAAAYATASIWADYHQAIIATYGTDRGGRIWNAIRGNTPWTECTQYGSARRALSPGNGQNSARRTRPTPATRRPKRSPVWPPNHTASAIAIG